jgi:mannose-6-phosphate isomerase-like protein (cupin superfamily)
MKIIFKHQTIERRNSETCVITEYPMNEEMIDFAIVKVKGRYPETPRQAINLKCKEIVYIHTGSGKVVVESQEYSLNAGDLILIEAGEKFYWDGNMDLFISCRPAFKVVQHQIVD